MEQIVTLLTSYVDNAPTRTLLSGNTVTLLSIHPSIYSYIYRSTKELIIHFTNIYTMFLEKQA